MINDAHCHFFSAQFFATLARDVRPLPAGDPAEEVPRLLGWDPPGRPDALADRWVAELDRHDVARAALIASVPADEASVAAAAARHPSRFVGFFMLDPTKEDAPARADRAMAELKLRCVCLFPAMHHYHVDDPRVATIFDLASRHPGTAVFVHCGVLSVGVRKKLGLSSRFDMRLGDPLAVATVAAAYPQVPVIIPHFGAGMLREALMAADLCPSILLDTSSSNSWTKYLTGVTLTDVFRQALAAVGPDRLLFGTDSSFFPRGWQRSIWDAQVHAAEQLGLDGQTRTKIFTENFDRIFSRC
jgi:predicted TIM-barrel fold metal-dependent hydrolase